MVQQQAPNSQRRALLISLGRCTQLFADFTSADFTSADFQLGGGSAQHSAHLAFFAPHSHLDITRSSLNQRNDSPDIYNTSESMQA